MIRTQLHINSQALRVAGIELERGTFIQPYPRQPVSETEWS